MFSANKMGIDAKIITYAVYYNTYNLMMFKFVETVSEGWNS